VVRDLFDREPARPRGTRHYRGAIAPAPRIPAAELTLIPDTGHFVMEEAPDPVSEALLRLLVRPAAAAGSVQLTTS
jgi:pimeloyl-ACP methyl ester carboxylesterase